MSLPCAPNTPRHLPAITLSSTCRCSMQVYLCDERARNELRFGRGTHALEPAAPSVSGRESNSAWESCSRGGGESRSTISSCTKCHREIGMESLAPRPGAHAPAGIPQGDSMPISLLSLHPSLRCVLRAHDAERHPAGRGGVLSRSGCGAVGVVMGARHSPGTSARATPAPWRGFRRARKRPRLAPIWPGQKPEEA